MLYILYMLKRTKIQKCSRKNSCLEFQIKNTNFFEIPGHIEDLMVGGEGGQQPRQEVGEAAQHQHCPAHNIS